MNAQLEAPAHHRRALGVLFAVYLTLLVWTVLFKLHAPFIGRDDMRQVKLVPFAAGEGFGPSSTLEVMLNLLLFIPFGVYLGMLARRWPVIGAALTIASTSFALEVTQYVLAVGSSDVTDVIVNTAGGVVGLAIARVVRGRGVARLGVIMTVLALLAVGAHIASFPTMPAPGAGGVLLL